MCMCTACIEYYGMCMCMCNTLLRGIAHAHAHQQSIIIYHNVSQIAYYHKLINNFLKSNLEAGKGECQLGLEPRSLNFWPSALTIRPPALSLFTAVSALIQELRHV